MTSLQKRVDNLEKRAGTNPIAEIDIFLVDAATGEKDGPYRYINGELSSVGQNETELNVDLK